MAKRKGLGAATDDPRALISRAIREHNAAINPKITDQVGVREAAEKGWLAICALADVAADKMGLPEPGGASGRRNAIIELERQGKLRKGALLNTFETGRTVLHGECFHNDSCPIDVGWLLDGVKNTIDDGLATIRKVKVSRKR